MCLRYLQGFLRLEGCSGECNWRCRVSSVPLRKQTKHVLWWQWKGRRETGLPEGFMVLLAKNKWDVLQGDKTLQYILEREKERKCVCVTW